MNNEFELIEAPNLIWKTNLNQDDVIDIYQNLIKDPSFFIIADEARNGKQNNPLQMRFRIYNSIFDYSDGVCTCFAINERITLTYVPKLEWQILQARRIEKEEHLQQLEAEKEIAEILFTTEDEQFKAATEQFILFADFESAKEIFFKWIDFRESEKRPCYDLHDLFFQIFGYVHNIDATLVALRRLNLYANAYFRMAGFWVRKSKNDNESLPAILKKIFDQMISHHTNYWICKKECCLWLERNKFIDLAIEYCEKFIAEGIIDDTKSGFKGRLKRLHKIKNCSDTQPTDK